MLIDHKAKTLTVYTLDAEFKPIEIKDAPVFNMMAAGRLRHFIIRLLLMPTVNAALQTAASGSRRST